MPPLSDQRRSERGFAAEPSSSGDSSFATVGDGLPISLMPCTAFRSRDTLLLTVVGASLVTALVAGSLRPLSLSEPDR